MRGRRLAECPPVVDQSVTGLIPAIFRQELAKILFDFFRLRLPTPTEAVNYPFDMSINHHPWYIKGVAKNHIGSLATNTRQSHQTRKF